MPYKEGTLMQQVQPLVSARKNAVSGITAVLGVTLFVEEVQRIRVLPFSLVHYEYLALLAVTGALVFLWIWGSEELEMLGRWLDPQEFPVPSSFNQLAMIMGLAFVLVCLFFCRQRHSLVHQFIPALHDCGLPRAPIRARRHPSRGRWQLQAPTRRWEPHSRNLRQGNRTDRALLFCSTSRSSAFCGLFRYGDRVLAGIPREQSRHFRQACLRPKYCDRLRVGDCNWLLAPGERQWIARRRGESLRGTTTNRHAVLTGANWVVMSVNHVLHANKMFTTLKCDEV